MSQLRVREPRLVAHRLEADTSRQQAPRRSRILATVVVVAVVLLIVLFDLASRHAFGGNSDDATLVLQGQSISSGHFTLQGWDLSYDSFWTVDVIFYALAVRLLGVSPELLNLVPAVIAALLVLVSVLLTRQGRSDRGFFAGAGLVVALLALLVRNSRSSCCKVAGTPLPRSGVSSSSPEFQDRLVDGPWQRRRRWWRRDYSAICSP
jgi:hypothetical protein